MAQAKTKEQYQQQWILHVKDVYSVANDVIGKDFDLGNKIAGLIIDLDEAIQEAGELLEKEGAFNE